MKRACIYIVLFLLAVSLFGMILAGSSAGAGRVYAATENISIVSVDQNLIDAITPQDREITVSIIDIKETIILLSIMLTMLILSFTRQDIFLDAATGLLLVQAGLFWIDDISEVTPVLIVLGCFKFFSSIYQIFASGKGARGLSQLKELYRRIKGG